MAAICGIDFPPPVGMFSTTCWPSKMSSMASSYKLKSTLNVCCEYSQIIVVIDEKGLFLVRSKNRRKRSTLSPQCLQLCFDIIGHCLLISGIFSIAYLNEKEMGTNISCRIQIVLRQIQVFITSFLGCRSQTDTSSTHSFLAFLNNLASCANAFTYFFNFGFSKVSALT